MPPGTPWSAPQLIYFLGYALWMYVTLPYSFRLDGVAYEEVEPWNEKGETWRRLKVTYPLSFPSHSPEQTHYFDEKGLMRRQDYSVDVRNDTKVAHYMHGQQKFDGFIFPTRRRIYRCDANRTPLMDQLLISADLGDYQVT
jgi:hypothetical protein